MIELRNGAPPAGSEKANAAPYWAARDGARGRCAFPRRSALARSADQLARIEQAGGIEACLHPAQRRQASGAVELGEQVAFQLSDAVFGRDRSPEFKDMAVDEAAGILAMRGQPRRTVHALGRLDMVMDVAVAEMAEGQRADRSEEHTSELQSL